VVRKVLVANRGEIAVRVIRAAHELGLRAVAVYSEADAAALHCRMADEAVPIGPPSPKESYLNLTRLMEAASQSGADALHPGYGFLSENPALPALCALWGVTFVGPTAEAIRAMGDKAAARETARRAGVPVVPGSDGPVADAAEARRVAERVGYPLLCKASGGGGGRGIRPVDGPEALDEAFAQARREAESSFGQGEIYLERLLRRPRHIEIQVMADGLGNVVALAERESSLQRRRQKLLEEAPSVPLDPVLRERMEGAAADLARAVAYCGAGTVEFLLEPETGQFYFIEMNTRIQVEHAVTEAVLGLDLVKEQLRVAAGAPLSFDRRPEIRGWAIECRINAEDPEREFRPSPGTLSRFDPPGGPGIRVDSGFAAGDTIPPFYDSLLCKVVAHGRDREEARARMRRALAEFRIEGVKTTLSLHRAILDHPEFAAGALDTEWLERMVAATAATRDTRPPAA
jgi:acetyl-CoA carboxylase biotin carboxylase subunit